MYNVCLFLESITLLAKLTALHIWGEETQFEIQAVCSDFNSLLKLLKNKSFDLLIAENSLVEFDDYLKFLDIKNNKQCRHIALCSENGDFESARKGILIGAEDYFTLPFDEILILSLFDKIKDKHINNDERIKSSIDKFADKLSVLFINRSNDIYSYLEYINGYKVAAETIDKALGIIFQKNDWLDLYFNEFDFKSSNITEFSEQKSRFTGLYESYINLYPHHNDTLDDVIKYILYNPESDLRQKALSEELHINKSYLSTIFIAQTNIRFVDYISSIKLLRAAWLLKNTEMKVGEIAQKIDYKDVAYFSKQFKKSFSCSPSEYRLPDNYHFEI